MAVLEADRIAAGVTGHTTAKLTALHGLIYDRLRRTRGPEGARMYARSQSDAVERAVAITAELGIDCDLENVPAFTYTEDPARTDTIRAEVDAAYEAGLPASYVTETGLPYPVAGAIRAEGGAQFHPRGYLLALAEDLRAHGGRIHEHTRATGLVEGSPAGSPPRAGRW